MATTTVKGRKRNPSQRWTPEEDDKLRNAVLMHDSKNWKQIAKHFDNRTDIQCLQRWYEVLRPDLVKGPWTDEEDKLLIQLVMEYGCKKWSLVGSKISGRSGKQCRERWCNQLDPAIKRTPWSEEEENFLIECHRRFGSQWSQIAKYLPGRPDNSIKNHWNSVVKKKMLAMEADGTLPPRIEGELEPFEENSMAELVSCVPEQGTPFSIKSSRKRTVDNALDDCGSNHTHEFKRQKLSFGSPKGQTSPSLAARVPKKFQLTIDTAMCTGESHNASFDAFLKDLEVGGIYYDEVSRPEAVSPFPVAYRNLFGTNIQEQRKSRSPFLMLDLSEDELVNISLNTDGTETTNTTAVPSSQPAASSNDECSALHNLEFESSAMPGSFMYDEKNAQTTLPSLPELSRELSSVALPSGRYPPPRHHFGGGALSLMSPLPGTASPGIFYHNAPFGQGGAPPSLSPRFQWPAIDSPRQLLRAM